MRLIRRGVKIMSNDTKYEPKATTTKITATSRVSVKINDNFYTVEMSEERTLNDKNDIDLEKEQQALWDSVNNSVDNQIIDIKNAFAKR